MPDADLEDDSDDTQGDATGKRERSRSPNYPALPFSVALERAEKIYKKEKRSPVSPEVAVRHLGYTKENGATFQVLGALKRYGLVVSTGKGKDIRISDDAHFIFVHPDGHADRLTKMRALAMSPPLFSKILAAFDNELPSDENLVAKLQTDDWGFKSETAAKAVVRALRDAVRIRDGSVAPSDQDGDNNGEPTKEAAVTKPTHQAMNIAPHAPPPGGASHASVHPTGRPLPDPEAVSRRWEISEGRFAFVALPPDPTVDDVTIVEEFLGIMKQELALVWKRKSRTVASAPGAVVQKDGPP